jgi:O-antigen/teichoic acid export membrane protein
MKLWDNIRESVLVREAATVVSGNVLAQVISMLAYLVLTRIFSPSDYALFNIFYSYIEVLVILSTCKYELAVVVAQDDRETSAVMRFALRLNAVVALLLLTLVAVLYFAGGLPDSFSSLGAIVLLIPPMVFFSGSSRVYAALFNRLHRYRLIAAYETTNASAGSVLKALFGLVGLKQAGLPLGAVLGQASANLLYRFRLRGVALPKVSRSEQVAAARKHRNFPLFVASKDFINSLSASLPFLWLAMYFDRADVGLFGLAFTVVFRPVNLINNACERVLYARTAESVRAHRSIGSVIRHFLLVVAAVAVPVAVVGWFVAEPLFTFLFGSNWTGCGVYVRALIPWIVLSLSSTSLMFVSNIFSTQRIEFGFYLVLFVLRVAAIAVGIHAGSFLLAIRLYATAGALVAASLLVWYLWQVRCYERSLTN